MEIYVLTAEHGKNPGRILELFATKDAANIRAAELVNSFFADCEINATATPKNWETALTVNIYLSEDVDADWVNAYVLVEATEVQVAAPIDLIEIACRDVGWVQGGDHAGIIYHARRFASWKEAVLYAADKDDTLPVPGAAPSRTYETWAACAEGEGLLESAA